MREIERKTEICLQAKQRREECYCLVKNKEEDNPAIILLGITITAEQIL